MADTDQNSGVFTFMVGLIIVVMGGVGLSLLADRRFSFSSNTLRLQSEIESGSGEVEWLKALCGERSCELSGIEPKRRKAFDAYGKTREELDRLEALRTKRSTDLLTVRKEVGRLDEEFSRCRQKYRASVWAAAVGESLGDLKALSGRVYKKAVVTRVTEVGLEIRHEDGFARLQSEDLAPSFLERFQWNDDERRERLQEEAAQRSALGQVAALNIEQPLEERSATEGNICDDAKVDELRRNVRFWKSKVSEVQWERSEALSAEFRGGQSSVPGRLETWQTRMRRLDAELAKARAALAAAKASLAFAAPGDPLLGPGSGGW